MQFFIFFIIWAVMVGAGAMLSPAWPTRQPRVGQAAAFSLALIVGGAVFWAELFGWGTLVIDYLLFALVSVVVLGGTLSQAQVRAEAQGIELEDAAQGWPGPMDLVFFTVAGVLFSLPLFLYAVPPGGTAAANGLVTLAAREGGSFTTLAPIDPAISGFVAPGFHGISAYLSQQLGQPIPQIYLALGAVLGFLSVWVAYDLGGEIRDKRLGRAMALGLIVSVGVLNLQFSGHYPQLMAVLFALAYLLYGLRALRHGTPLDIVGGGLMLGAVLYVDPPLFVFCLLLSLLGAATLLIPRSIDKERSRPGTLTLRLLGVLLVAFLGTAPWTVQHPVEVLQLLNIASGDPSLIAMTVYALVAPLLLGFVLLWLWDRLPQGKDEFLLRYALVPLGIAAVLVVSMPLFIASVPLDTTWADLAAMNWLADNTEPDAAILNHPTQPWVQASTARTAAFAPRPDGFPQAQANAAAVAFWDEYDVAALDGYTHVLIPQNLADIPLPDGLQLVYEADGARVAEVAELEQ